MNKRDIVHRVARQAMLPQKQSARAVNTMLEAIITAVSTGDSVTISGFGTFGLQHRQPRQGRHPKTGATLQIPAKTTPTFSASRAFKLKVSDQLYILRIPPLSHRRQHVRSQSVLFGKDEGQHHLRSITEKLLNFFKGESEQN